MNTGYLTKREMGIIRNISKKYPENVADVSTLKKGIISILERLADNSTDGNSRELRDMANYYKRGE